jgi:hypothetical protein
MLARLLLDFALLIPFAKELVSAILTSNVMMETHAPGILATSFPRCADGRTLPLLATMVMLAPLMSAMLPLVAHTLLFLPISVTIKAFAPLMFATVPRVAYTPTSLALTITCALMIFATPSVAASASQ